MIKSQVEPDELTKRIRWEARRHENLAFPPPAPASASAHGLPPPAPVFAADPSGGFSCESLLAQVGNLLDRARGKTTVRKGVPKLLRPVYRNQGGYNDIVLEALERLRESNRLLMTENAHLRLHVQKQTEWMQAAERQFAGIEKRFAKARDETAPAGATEGD